jgi:hypothetical protein
MKIYIYVITFLLVLNGCNKNEKKESSIKSSRTLAKFEPKEGVLVFVGQDLSSIGGLKEFTNGYADFFVTPAGITLYTGIGANDPSFGGKNKTGLEGIYATIDAGNGPSNMTTIMQASKFKNSILAIGLSMVNNEKNVAAGKLDQAIYKLGIFLKSLHDRPVFLRIGYEFDGHPWNHYERKSYVTAYRRIVDRLREQGITNVAFVWQSTGFPSNEEQLQGWYPGDNYVDWCAFSFFDRFREQSMVAFARKKGKPVFIAEASATISDYTAKFDGKTKETILSNPIQAREAWNNWFVPFFDLIEKNKDVVKAIHYIDCNWKERPMWFDNPTFQNIDARIETSPMITKKWKEKMALKYYINASDTLFKYLKNTEK